MAEALGKLPLALAATNVLAIATASTNASLTLFLIPRFLELPPPLNVRRWHSMFEVTKWGVAGPMVTSGLSYLCLAYRLRSNPDVLALLVAAGSLCLSVVPFTYVMVLPTIDKLRGKLKVFENASDLSQVDETGEKAHSLIGAWGKWNMGRAIPVMVAGLIGMYVAELSP
jgi:ABC-type spermidine/putrescine transport system permease subunit II